MHCLASATPPNVPLPADAGGAYSYDWVGNMKAAAPSIRGPTTPIAHGLAGMHSYSYDDNGAVTTVNA